jgi:hypothetical protein
MEKTDEFYPSELYTQEDKDRQDQQARELDELLEMENSLEPKYE